MHLTGATQALQEEIQQINRRHEEQVRALQETNKNLEKMAMQAQQMVSDMLAYMGTLLAVMLPVPTIAWLRCTAQAVMHLTVLMVRV
jgi:predicted RNA-binding protein Jag